MMNLMKINPNSLPSDLPPGHQRHSSMFYRKRNAADRRARTQGGKFKYHLMNKDREDRDEMMDQVRSLQRKKTFKVKMMEVEPRESRRKPAFKKMDTFEVSTMKRAEQERIQEIMLKKIDHKMGRTARKVNKTESKLGNVATAVDGLSSALKGDKASAVN